MNSSEDEPAEALDTFPYDFFISRTGRAAEIAKEICAILEDAGRTVIVQDLDMTAGDNFVCWARWVR